MIRLEGSAAARTSPTILPPSLNSCSMAIGVATIAPAAEVLDVVAEARASSDPYRTSASRAAESRHGSGRVRGSARAGPALCRTPLRASARDDAGAAMPFVWRRARTSTAPRVSRGRHQSFPCRRCGGRRGGHHTCGGRCRAPDQRHRTAKPVSRHPVAGRGFRPRRPGGLRRCSAHALGAQGGAREARPHHARHDERGGSLRSPASPPAVGHRHLHWMVTRSSISPSKPRRRWAPSPASPNSRSSGWIASTCGLPVVVPDQ